MTIYYSAKARTFNHPHILPTIIDSIIVGRRGVFESLAIVIGQHLRRNKIFYLLALDGYLGVDWKSIIEELRQVLKIWQVEIKAIDMCSYMKNTTQIDKMILPYLVSDPYFGFVFEGEIEQFFDSTKLARLKEELNGYRQDCSDAQKYVIICYGIGSAIKELRQYFNQIVYFDLTREELFNRSGRAPIECLGSRKGKHPVRKNLKRFCYIDSVVLDQHKKKVLEEIDWYVDSNNPDEPKLIPRTSYDELINAVAREPIIVKQLYNPVVWGGNWQKNLKKLPASMPNSGQGSIVPDENSVEIYLGGIRLDIPFQNLFGEAARTILGDEAFKVTQGKFPLSYFYDDQLVGDHMAIQVHPDDMYIKQKFNESMRQDESYYILRTGLGAKTYIGLKEEANIDDFRKEVEVSAENHSPFEYEKYVNNIETKPGDFILIPAGTIHASGKNQVVVEIDWVNTAYTPGYTFHIYDYQRPDLDGTFRAMHIEHAFNVLNEERRTKWVRKYLKQRPELHKKGEGWAEYIIGSREDMLFEVRRLEFQNRIYDRTDRQKTFHALTLVEGNSVIIQSIEKPDREYQLDFPDTIIIPACMGHYRILSLDAKPCKVVKALVRL